MGESLQDQVEAAIDEALSSGEWVDVLVSLLRNNFERVRLDNNDTF